MVDMFLGIFFFCVRYNHAMLYLKTLCRLRVSMRQTFWFSLWWIKIRQTFTEVLPRANLLEFLYMFSHFPKSLATLWLVSRTWWASLRLTPNFAWRLSCTRKANGRRLRRWTEKCWKSGAESLERTIQPPWVARTIWRMSSKTKASGRRLRRCTEKCWKSAAESLERSIQTSWDPRTIWQLPLKSKGSGRRLRRCTEKCWKSWAESLERSIRTP